MKKFDGSKRSFFRILKKKNLENANKCLKQVIYRIEVVEQEATINKKVKELLLEFKRFCQEYSEFLEIHISFQEQLPTVTISEEQFAIFEDKNVSYINYLEALSAFNISLEVH